MSNTTLSNGLIEFTVKSKGAELCSLKSGKTQYIWQGDPTYWNRHAPLLFPVVGKLKDDGYTANGVSYKMGQHGFARDKDFELEKKSDSKLVYRLHSTVDTQKIYPYEFTLEVEYRLCGKRLEIEWRVIAKSELYFSIGAHPAFNWPVQPSMKQEDFVLAFSANEQLEKRLLDGELLSSSATAPLPMKGNILPLTKELFKDGVLVIKNKRAHAVTIADTQGNKYITMEFEGFPDLGIWSKNTGSPFVCIEPWYGHSDTPSVSGRIEDKPGILHLAAGKTFKAVHSIEICNPWADR